MAIARSMIRILTPTRNDAILTPKNRNNDSPNTHAAIKTTPTVKALTSTVRRRAGSGWLAVMLMHRGTAPIGFTMTSIAVKILMYAVSSSIRHDHFQYEGVSRHSCIIE